MTDRNVVRFVGDPGNTTLEGDRQRDGAPYHETILRTKLHRPPLSADLVRRARLLELMTAAAAKPLTVVSAPAGYGKSVLVSQWAEQHEHPVAWLSLDESDADLRTFLSYLLAAINAVAPNSCPKTARLVEAPEIPPVPVMAGVLINELDAAAVASSIVLDDFHRISHISQVQALMRQVLEHPPARLHVVIITRRDPPLALAQLRAGNHLTEIRLQDLSFTGPEIAHFVTTSAGPDICREAIENLAFQMEGWAAGLRLVSLALRQVEDAEAFLKQLRGGIQTTREYLLHEILLQRSPRMRQWLLQTSILDRFCPDLCDAIDAAGDGADGNGFDGRQFMSEAQQGNLFVISLDNRGEWFRYHHLFQELLRRELQLSASPHQIATLNSRAGEWFESEGLIDEALHYALEAGEVAQAAQLVERHRIAMLNADRWYVLERWLSLLPEAVVSRRAELLIAHAWVLLRRLRIVPMLEVVNRVERLVEDHPNEHVVHGELALFRGFVAFFQGDGGRSAALLKQAMEHMPDRYHEPHSEAETLFALATQMEGRQKRAVRRLDEQLRRPEVAHGLRKRRLLAAYVFLHIIAGDLADAELANRRLRESVADSPYVHVEAWGDYLQGLIHLYRGELEAAVEFSHRSSTQKFIHHKRAAVDSFVAEMIALQALGRPDEALATLQLLRDYSASLQDPAFTALTDGAEARLAIMQARTEAATRWLRRTASPSVEVMMFWFEIPCITRCRALIAEGSSAGLGKAEQRLRDYAELSESHHNICQLISILALQALACEKQKKHGEGRVALGRAVALAGPGGFIFPFIEIGPEMAVMLKRLEGQGHEMQFIRRLLCCFADTALPGTAPDPAAAAPSMLDEVPAAAQPVRDALTNRELDVLELLAQRFQNKEIAARLCISSHTVTDHLKGIYRKLGVGGRRQAVERAVEVGLLSQD